MESKNATLVAAALFAVCLLGIAYANAENATIVEFHGHGVLTLPTEKNGFVVTEKYVVDSSDAEVVVRFENGSTYNITAGYVLRSKA